MDNIKDTIKNQIRTAGTIQDIILDIIAEMNGGGRPTTGEEPRQEGILNDMGYLQLMLNETVEMAIALWDRICGSDKGPRCDRAAEGVVREAVPGGRYGKD